MVLYEVVIGLARKLFEETDDEITRRRAEITEQVADDQVRTARRQQLASPRISSTPFPEAIQRLGQNIERLRKRAYESAQAAATDQLALELAEKSRETLLEAEARHSRENSHNGHPATYPEWEAFVDELFARGVTRHKIRQLSELEVSIIADLIRWKVEDAKHIDPNSPWRAVLDEYCNRTLEMLHGKRGGGIELSVPGPPPKPKNYAPFYWQRDRIRRFNHAPAHEEPAPSVVDSAPSVAQDGITVPSMAADEPDTPRKTSLQQSERAELLSLGPSELPDPTVCCDLAEVATGPDDQNSEVAPIQPELTYSMACELAVALMAKTTEFFDAEWSECGISPNIVDDKEAILALENIMDSGIGNWKTRIYHHDIKNHGLEYAKFICRDQLCAKLAMKIFQKDAKIMDDIKRLSII